MYILTNVNICCLHDVLVFLIHGPDVAIEQAGWVWHRVVPRAAEKDKKHQLHVVVRQQTRLHKHQPEQCQNTYHLLFLHSSYGMEIK